MSDPRMLTALVLLSTCTTCKHRVADSLGGQYVMAGNVHTGTQVNANRGAVYNPTTGATTQYGGIRGRNSGMAHYGDNVYAGYDGNV